MDVLLGAVAAVGHAIEQVLIYVETHHWIFAFSRGAAMSFYLHDRAVHARFDALEKAGRRSQESVSPLNFDGTREGRKPGTRRRLCRRAELAMAGVAPRSLWRTHGRQGFNPREKTEGFLAGKAALNHPALGLTDYCWAHSARSIASHHESKCHASAVQSCPASCVRGLDGDFGRWARAAARPCRILRDR